MIAWSFEYSVETRASRDRAWQFWSNVDNWAVVDPAVEWAKLDGPFTAGSRGTTKPRGQDETHWQIIDVEPGKRAVIEIEAPGAVLRCTWVLEDAPGGGAVLRQRAELDGERAAEYAEAGKELQAGIPAGMRKLADAIDGSDAER